MTKEQVRERIAEQIWEFERSPSIIDYQHTRQATKDGMRRVADAILSLTYPNGQPMIAVLDEDQSTPLIGEYHLECGKKAQADMIKAGWRKTV
jgi:hypothetical protein